MKLGQGECIVTFDGSKVYHIRVPMLRFSDDVRAAARAAGINHQRPKRQKGLNIASNIDKWIGGGAE
jgi:hypothetical protein